MTSISISGGQPVVALLGIVFLLGSSLINKEEIYSPFKTEASGTGKGYLGKRGI